MNTRTSHSHTVIARSETTRQSHDLIDSKQQDFRPKGFALLVHHALLAMTLDWEAVQHNHQY